MEKLKINGFIRDIEFTSKDLQEFGKQRKEADKIREMRESRLSLENEYLISIEYQNGKITSFKNAAYTPEVHIREYWETTQYYHFSLHDYEHLSRLKKVIKFIFIDNVEIWNYSTSDYLPWDYKKHLFKDRNITEDDYYDYYDNSEYFDNNSDEIIKEMIDRMYENYDPNLDLDQQSQEFYE